ncbi:cytochrome c-551 [Sideroxyarcus emersonii]|uniref:Cytochrome c-551 n=1 Tax=Sideroxyarcus emersonii TaxID=2764705 RepID=A0AAN2C019_9PROT|nr:c-type cytochrome [Sideroxyarcus emersonii]BCK88656.1 cytochrome c-551 [Sideroxyarcus emersonii]
MKSVAVNVLAAASMLLVAGSAMATGMPELAQKSSCTSCHAIDKKLVGPAWMDIARKYKGDAGAEARLIAKVAKGGSGAWGAMPMPPNSPRVSDADIKTLVKFILSLSK